MIPHAPSSLLLPLHRLLADERRRQASDRDLLQAFTRHNEADAFAELLRRHGPMVLRLALHLLHQRQDAEDVLQAVFLTLARKASSLRNESSVAGWLYRVTWRLALRSRARRPPTLTLPHKGGGESASDPADEISLREARAMLHEELAALPEQLRLPLVLCYFEGQTRDEAARRLGWSLGTFKRRLEHGRKLLHARLSRRGLTLSAVLSTTLLVSVDVSASLIEQTLRLAQSCSVAEVTAPVAALLAETVMPAKMKALGALVLLLATLAGAGAWIFREQASNINRAQEAPPTARDEKTPAAARDRFGDPLPPGALARMGTIRFRHGDVIEAISLSADGKTLVAASRDLTVRLWDVATGRELRRLPGHEGNGPAGFGSLRYVAFSPSGKVLATGVSYSGIVRLWDAATGKELRQLKSPDHGWLGHVALSADDKLVAASANNHCILVWETQSGRLIHKLDGKEKNSFAGPLAFSPDGKTLVSGGLAETLRLWDLKTGKEIRRFIGQPAEPRDKRDEQLSAGLVETVAYSPDGRILASSGLHAPVRLWDVATGKEIRSLLGNRYGAYSLAFAPDGKTLASGESEGIIRVWEVATGKEIRHIPAHNAWVSGLAYLPDGKTLVSSGDSAIRLWDAHTGAEVIPDRGHTTSLSSMVVLADGRTVVTGGEDYTVRWWDLPAGKELRRLPNLSAVTPSWGMALSPSGTVAAYHKQKSVSKWEGHVGLELWDLTARKKWAELWRPNIFAAQFSPDGKVLYTQVADLQAKQLGHSLILWDVATGKELQVLAKNPNGFDGFHLSADGKILAATIRGAEPSILVWDVATGKELCRIPGDPHLLQSLAISADNKLLAVVDGMPPRPSSDDPPRYIRLWDIASGKQVHRFGRSPNAYWPVAFSTDGRTLATSGAENQIRLWELATGSERLRFAGHTGRIVELIFAQKDQTLLSTSSDTTALVWDVSGLRSPTQATDTKQAAPSPAEQWKALADPDAAAAYRLMGRLIASPAEALALLRPRLKPAEGVDEKRIEQLLADLDSDVFAVREKAAQELHRLGDLAEPACRKVLDAQPLLEKRRRVQTLLADIHQQRWQPSGELLRQVRAVEVLERIGTPEARNLLQSLAGGAPGARLTGEAQAALRRGQAR